MLAEVGFFVAAMNGNDLQVFAVGCAADSCESLLKNYAGLIVDPKFKIGKEMSKSEIQAFELKPNHFQKVI